ncbi:MAG: hypothetical protein HKN12_07930, partial [Gemmatimonadetes bacterium]|nr:hypothetical protein [Gemmatimonadota bacterium]
AIARLRAGITAVVFGMVCGLGLFTATAWLLIRGGQDVGKTLGLLGNYFPGYSVTWPGAFVGLLWGLVFGSVVGFATAWIYNKITDLRN